MKHDEFDDLLGEIARRSHNPPPPVPREAIWAGLEAARGRREGARAGPEPVAQAMAVPTSGPNRRQQATLPLRWWGLGIAATLALGIGIGRVMEREVTSGAVPVPGEPTAGGAPAVVVEAPPTVASGDGASPRVSPTLLADGAAPGVGSGSVQEGMPRPTTLRAGGSAQGTAQAVRAGPTEAAPRTAPRAPGEAASTTFRLAALEHLVRTEVLLTSFQVDAQAGRVDLGLEGWARELLSTTRLLLDSPAATEPRLERLLRDLELVLVQIAQYPESRAPGELELIDQALLDNDVITRLRLAVPSGPLQVRS